MQWLLRLHDGLTRLTFWGATLCVAYLTLVTAWEVFGRYALDAPSDWAPDTAAVSFALASFLAVPMLTWKHGHAAMTFLVDAAPAPVTLWMRRLTLAVGVATCALCAWYGGIETLRQIDTGVMVVAVTPIPKWIVSGAIVYALGSASLYFLRHLAGTFIELPAARTEEAEWTGT